MSTASFLSTLTASPDMVSTLPAIDAPLYDCDTLLYHASHLGNLTLIQALIRHHADLNAQGFSGPALHESILQGHNPITSYLIDQGADINLPSLSVIQNGFSPLHTAIVSSNTFAIELLLKVNANLLARDSELNTPLHIAVNEQNYAFAALLLSHGASMVAINSNQETPFCLAIDSGNMELLELFIDQGVFKSAPQLLNDSLIRAVNAQNDAAVQLLLRNGADVNFVSSYKRFSPLHHAAVANNVPVVETLLRNGVDVAARTETNSLAIVFSAHRKNESIVDLLLEKHATVGPDLAELLYEAVMDNCELLIKKILSFRNYDLNVDGFAPGSNVRLLEAAILGNKHGSVRALMFCGADVELIDSRGLTLWDLAFEQRNFDFFDSWLHHGGGFYHLRSRKELYLSRLEKMIHLMETDSFRGWRLHWELIAHLIMMKSCGFFTHSRYGELTDDYGTRERDSMEGDCVRELEKVKAEVLEGVSGWELLEMDDRKLGIWSRKIGRIDRMAQFETFFHSRNWLHDCYRRGARRLRLVKQLQECYREVLKIKFDCLEGIVEYLDNDDIRNFIFVCNGQGQQ